MAEVQFSDFSRGQTTSHASNSGQTDAHLRSIAGRKGMSTGMKIGLAVLVVVIIVVAVGVGVAFGTGAIGGKSSSSSDSVAGANTNGGQSATGEPTAVDVSLAFQRNLEQVDDAFKTQVSNGVCTAASLATDWCTFVSAVAGSIIAKVRITPKNGVTVTHISETAVAAIEKQLPDPASTLRTTPGFEAVDPARGVQSSTYTPPPPPPAPTGTGANGGGNGGGAGGAGTGTGTAGSGGGGSVPNDPSTPPDTSYSGEGSIGGDGKTVYPPTGPNFDATTPFSVAIFDWANHNAPREVGKLYFNSRQPDLVFDHPWMAAAAGPISIVHSTQSIVFGKVGEQFEFGATLIAHSPKLNANNTKNPVYQVLVSAKPYARWATYPARRTWDPTKDINHPAPFKVVIRGVNDVNIGTIQMADGLAINDRTLGQNRNTTTILRPWWHVGMMLKWQNYLLKDSTYMNKWFGGFTLDSLRPSQAKWEHATNAPLVMEAWGSNMRTQVNGNGQWHAMPRFPMTRDPKAGQKQENHDPNLSWIPSYCNHNGHGWFYEPGNPGGHDQMTGPGGARSDRGPIATPLAIYYANRTWIRPLENNPIRELVEHWGDNYFNHGGYWIRNLTTFASLPMDEVHRVRWSFAKPYYGSQLTEIPQGDKTAWDYNVELRVAAQGSYDSTVEWAQSYYYDSKGISPWWNGWGVDAHHVYQFSGWHALMFNSGAHVLASRQAYTWQVMTQLGAKTFGKEGNFLYRTHAFRWMHWLQQWILRNNHPTFGIDGTQMENKFHNDLAQIDVFRQDAIAEKTPSDACMNRLGTYLSETNLAYPSTAADGTVYLSGTQSSLGYYGTLMYALMKTSGLWAKLRQNPTSATNLDWIFEKMDQYMLGKLIYGKERMSWQSPRVSKSQAKGYTFTVADIPTSWQDWAVQNPSTQGDAETFVKNADGTFKSGNNEYSPSHVELAWAYMRRDYFPEVTNKWSNLIPQACAIITQGYADVEANVKAQTSIWNKNSNDWTYRWPHTGFLLPPQ